MSNTIYSIQEKLDSILDIDSPHTIPDSELFDLDGFPALKWGTDTRFDNTGIPHTEETKKILSKINKGNKPWNTGIKRGSMSEEQKKKISDKMKGRKLTKKHIANISKARLLIEAKKRDV